MLEIQQLRQNSETILKALEKRRLKDASETINKVLKIDSERRKCLTELEGLRHEQKKVSDGIGQLFAQKKLEEANAAKEQTKTLKNDISTHEEKVRGLEEEQKQLLYNLPNAPHESVPAGTNETDNEVIDHHGEAVKSPEWAKPHWELLETLDIVDFNLGAKITGAGFPVYKGKGAKFQRGLVQFFLDEADKAGFLEIQPPLLINEASGYGTGQLPDKEGQMYHATVDDLYLIPTAEVPITNMYRDVIIKEADLPIKNCGYTPCFRREAGSYGKHVRGLNRLHQFDKVEIVVIVKPEDSYAMLEQMLTYVKSLLEKLELPYRTLNLCGGDLGFTAAKTYDMEVYSSAQERWLEVSSISNFETFQANRLKLRLRGEDKPYLAHTLNGSALALPRIFAALIENNQQEDGSILLPKVLHSYCGFEKIE